MTDNNSPKSSSGKALVPLAFLAAAITAGWLWADSHTSYKQELMIQAAAPNLNNIAPAAGEEGMDQLPPEDMSAIDADVSAVDGQDVVPVESTTGEEIPAGNMIEESPEPYPAGEDEGMTEEGDLDTLSPQAGSDETVDEMSAPAPDAAPAVDYAPGDEGMVDDSTSDMPEDMPEDTNDDSMDNPEIDDPSMSMPEDQELPENKPVE